MIARSAASNARACATVMATEPFVETMPDTPSAGSPAMVVGARSLTLALGAVSVTAEPLGAVTVMSAASRLTARVADSATLVSLASRSSTPRSERLLIWAGDNPSMFAAVSRTASV